jgi:hypothetical protein
LLNSRFARLAIGVVCLLPFVRLLYPGDEIVSDPWRDYGGLHLPLAEFAREELLAGNMPLWNPYVGCGHPLHAAQQAALCYPLSTPLIVALGANRGLKVCIFAHLAICFAGTYLLARRLDISALAASYAALTVTWSGALMGHLAEGHVSIVVVASLVPWFFLSLYGFLAKPSAMTTLLLSVAGALCALAGHPQIVYYTFVGGGLCAAWSFWLGAAARQRRRVVTWGTCAPVIVALLSAVQLLPTLELVRDGLTESGRGTAGFSAIYALNGADVARLFMPYLNGTPFAGVPQFDRSDFYHERVVYLGLGAPLLATYALTRGRATNPHPTSPLGRGDLWEWGAACSVLLALAVALGDSTPLLGVLRRLAPGLTVFRCPGRVFCVASLSAALLAGRGLDALARREPRAAGISIVKPMALVFCAANLFAYAGLKYLPSIDWQRYVQYLRHHSLADISLWAVLALDVAIVFLLATAGPLRASAASWALIATAVVDLGYFNVGNFRMESLETTATARLPPADEATRFVEASSIRYLDYDALRYSRCLQATIPAHRAAVGTDDGGVLPAATARLYKTIETEAAAPLALAACGFAWPRSSAQAVRLNGTLPRFYFVPDEAATLLATEQRLSDIDLRVEEISKQTIGRLRENLVEVKLLPSEPRRLEIEVDAQSHGWLILADTFYPGWHCEVDGAAQPIERANGIFRRVRIEHGLHRMHMAYDPISFRLGLLLTATGIAAAMVLSISDAAMWRRGRRCKTYDDRGTAKLEWRTSAGESAWLRPDGH